MVCVAVAITGCSSSEKKEAALPKFKTPVAGLTQAYQNGNGKIMINNETLKLVDDKAPVYQLSCTILAVDSNMNPTGKQSVAYRYDYKNGEMEFNPAPFMGKESSWKKYSKNDENDQYFRVGLTAFKTAFGIDFPFGNSNKSVDSLNTKATISNTKSSNGITIPEGYKVIKTQDDYIVCESKTRYQTTGGPSKIYDKDGINDCINVGRNCYGMKIVGGLDNEVVTIYKDGRVEVHTEIGSTILIRYYKDNKLVIFRISPDPGAWATAEPGNEVCACNKTHKLNGVYFRNYFKIGLRQVFRDRWKLNW